MREILFRAFNTNSRVMLQNVPVCHGNAMTWRMAPKDSPVITLENGDSTTNFYCDWDFLKEDPYLEVMQFTGLTDCNGVKIFEGDILRCADDCLWVVAFDDRGSFIAHEPKDNLVFLMIDDYNFEVIGNIHQNPELLERTHVQPN